MRKRAPLCAVLAIVLLSACKTELYTGLTEREANEIVSVLRLNAIAADRKMVGDGKVTVFVEESQFASAVEILKSEGYPRRDYSNLGEVFQGNGFVVSQTEERARFIFAMSEELSRTITEIDGILSARTHVVLPTSDPLSRNSTPSSASVVIRHAEGAAVEELLPQIKMMVANSIEGLDYGHVSVVFIPVAKRPLPVAQTPVATAAGLPFWQIGVASILLSVGAMGAGAVMVWQRQRGKSGRAPFIVESAKKAGG